MKNSTLLLAITALFLMSNNLVMAQDVPVTTETYTIVYYTDELDAQFYKAYVDHINGDDKLAAAHVNKAAAYVEVEAKRAKEKDQKALGKVHQELLSLATDLDAGNVESSKRMSDIFAKTHYALASHHYTQAVLLMSKKDTHKAGYAIKNASKHLEHAARWSGEEVGEGSEASWRETKKISHSIGQGAKVSAVDHMTSIG
jgi:hypothetical protein